MAKNNIEADLFKKLSNKTWRLNNLYYILDKQGSKIQFQMNKHQFTFYNNMHNNNIILKARQLGFTTFICLWILDECLFNKNKRAGIIAHNLEDAQSFFRDKIKYPFDNLPDEIKKIILPESENKTEISFNNGSIIRVGTSMRGGTFQYMLVSEFGKICARMPDKAKEIITGTLNTLQAGQYCFIESTAEGQAGYFYDMCQDAISKKNTGALLSDMDYKFHFFPWQDASEYNLSQPVHIPKALLNYFDKLAYEENIHLTQEQKQWYCKKYETQKEDIKREFPSTPQEAFEQSLEGAYYSKYIADIEQSGRITNARHDPTLPVKTYWDLGMNDATAIIFVQQFRNEIRIIDYYEQSGEGLPHYARYLASLPYTYAKHYAPHDIAVRELGTGNSRLETAYNLGIKFNITPNIPVIDGINAVRQILPNCFFNKDTTERLIACLRNYRKEWDDKNGRWKDKPVHDEFEHGASAFRYLAVNTYTKYLNNDIFNNDITNLNMHNNQQVVEGFRLW